MSGCFLYVVDLRQNVTCCHVDLVPFLPSQAYLSSFDAVCKAGKIGSTGDGLHLCRVAQDPRKGKGSFGNTVRRCYLIHYIIKMRELFVVNKATLEEAVLHR